MTFLRLALAAALGLAILAPVGGSPTAHASRGLKKAPAKAKNTARSRAKVKRDRQRSSSSNRVQKRALARNAKKKATFVKETSNPIKALPKGEPGRVVVGVMGGAGKTTPKALAEKMHVLGQTIAEGGHVTLTGAAPGLPDLAVRGAKSKNGLTVGISSFPSKAAHMRSGSPSNLDVIQLTELHPSIKMTATQAGVSWRKIPNFMGRELPNIHFSDAIVIVGGRFGTLGELALALEDRRPIGVLTGSGGMADQVKRLVAASVRAGKSPAAPIIYDSNPKRLVTRLVKATQKHLKTRLIGPVGEGLVPTK